MSVNAKDTAAATYTRAAWMDPDDLVIIGLDTEDGPEHYLFDERVKLPMDDLKVKGVLANGVDEPVDVVKDGQRNLVADGRQRVRWAREANRIQGIAYGDPSRFKVQVITRRGDENDHMRRMVRVNEHREMDPPYTKAKKAARMLARGMSRKQIALEFAVSNVTLGHWLSLLELAPDVQKKVESGEMPAHEALGLKDLPHQEQAEKATPEARKAKKADTLEKAKEKKANKKRDAEFQSKRQSQSQVRRMVDAMEASLKSDKVPAGQVKAVTMALLWSIGDVDFDDAKAYIAGWPKELP